MRTFVDESGSFGWRPAGISLFCGVTIAERTLPSVFERFARWKRSVIGDSKRELKGCELTPKQLHSFTYRVMPAADRDIWLTLVGVNTRLMSELLIGKIRDSSSDIFGAASEAMMSWGNTRIAETYRQMSGWVRNRSLQNVLWVYGLTETVVRVVQHCIARFLEPEDDSEFENIRLSIDESFIRRDEHVTFWREWFRNMAMNRSESERLAIPDVEATEPPLRTAVRNTARPA